MNYSEFLFFLKKVSRLNINYEKCRNDFLQSKAYYKSINDEKELLKIWFAITALEIVSEYKNTFNLLKKREYQNAWYKLEDIEIMSENIKFNIDNHNDYLMLRWIESVIKKYQSIYPYKVFISPEFIDKKVECSICGCTMTPFSECKHIPGKVYCGDMCSRIVVDMEPILFALVEKPVQKYSVIFDGIEKPENYQLLEYLMPKLKHEFTGWDYRIQKKYKPHMKIGRDENCPCLSGKKYKDCCLNNPKGIEYEHYEFFDPRLEKKA